MEIGTAWKTEQEIILVSFQLKVVTISSTSACGVSFSFLINQNVQHGSRNTTEDQLPQAYLSDQNRKLHLTHASMKSGNFVVQNKKGESRIHSKHIK